MQRPHVDEELAHLRRIARVSWQVRRAERRWFASRDRHDLAALWDFKHQLGRLLDQYARRWGRDSR